MRNKKLLLSMATIILLSTATSLLAGGVGGIDPTKPHSQKTPYSKEGIIMLDAQKNGSFGNEWKQERTTQHKREVNALRKQILKRR